MDHPTYFNLLRAIPHQHLIGSLRPCPDDGNANLRGHALMTMDFN
jgi:hypothetical protein